MMKSMIGAIAGVLVAATTGMIGDVGAGEQPVKPDGTWVVQSILRDPGENGTGEGAGLRVKISGEHVYITGTAGEVIGALLIKTRHPAKGPEEVDCRVDESAFGKPIEQIWKETPVLAIYEKKNKDELRICWAPLEQRKRPTEFASKPGSGHTLVVLKRAE